MHDSWAQRAMPPCAMRHGTVAKLFADEQSKYTLRTVHHGQSALQPIPSALVAEVPRGGEELRRHGTFTRTGHSGHLPRVFLDIIC